MDFQTFKNKYILEGDLIVLTALHIGSGIESDKKDAPFISLDSYNEFYVPGSSFRGYLSTKLERLLDSSNNFGLKDKETGDFLNEADVKLIFGYTNLDKENTSVQKRVAEKLGIEIDEKETTEEKLKNIKSMMGRIHISDMRLETKVASITRDGIKIDRETGATEKGGKFDYDVVPAGTIFKMIIELENIEEYQLDLIGLAFNDIMSNEGDLFGGKTSRGIGRCKVENLKLSYVTSSNIEALKKYIFEGKFSNIKENYEFSTDNLDVEIKNN